MGLMNYLIINILGKFLVGNGYVPKDTNLNMWWHLKSKLLVQSTVDVIISGILIHVSLFFAYFFLKVSLPLKIQPGLVISYGLLFQLFIKPIFKRLEGK